VTTAFGHDPTSGHLFLFVNRRRDRLKILYWDRGDGLAIWYKRLEIGSFQLPVVPGNAVSIEMTPTQLALILSGIDLRSARQRKRYQRSTPDAENRPVAS
jgi:transposase